MAEAKEKKEKAPEPNIKFIGQRRALNEDGKELNKMARLEDPELVPTRRRDGEMEFKLPSGEEQLAGFYHEHAARLARAWPKEFKLIKTKGGK